MMRCILALGLAALLQACALTGQNAGNLTPAQIHEIAKEKNAALFCAVLNSPFGRGILVSISSDKLVLDGRLTVNEKCEIGLTLDPRAKVTAPAAAGGAP